MGILDVFKKRKDEFSENPELGMQPLEPQGFPPSDQGMNMQDPFSPQPSFQSYPPPSQPQNFNPEQMGFERVSNSQGNNNYSSQSHSQTLNEINIGKDFEIINAKLDAIKAELDSINQRIKRIERMNETDTTQKRETWF